MPWLFFIVIVHKQLLPSEIKPMEISGSQADALESGVMGFCKNVRFAMFIFDCKSTLYTASKWNKNYRNFCKWDRDIWVGYIADV